MRYNVVWGADDIWDFQRFNADGSKVGQLKDLSLVDTYGSEVDFSQDIDGDGVIGAPAGARAGDTPDLAAVLAVEDFIFV